MKKVVPGVADGWMCFGGTEGYTLFHPDSIKLNEAAPPIFITDIHINDHRIFDDPDNELKDGLL